MIQQSDIALQNKLFVLIIKKNIEITKCVLNILFLYIYIKMLIKYVYEETRCHPEHRNLLNVPEVT